MPTISEHLQNFFAAEIRNEDAMRRDAGAPGTDEYEATFDASSDLHVPQADLGTALDSWNQAPDDVRADFTGAPVEVLPEVEADLRALTGFHGEDYPLVDLLP